MFSTPSSKSVGTHLRTHVPEVHFNNDRDASDRLCGERLRIQVQLSEAVRAQLTAALSDLRERIFNRADAWKSVLQTHVHAEVVRVDGRVLECFSRGLFVPVPSPSVHVETPLASAATVPDSLTILVDREFPLSSAHGNAPMRLAIHVGDEVALSNSFSVFAKKGKRGQAIKKRKEVVIPEATHDRIVRFSRIAAALGQSRAELPTPPAALPMRAPRSRTQGTKRQRALECDASPASRCSTIPGGEAEEPAASGVLPQLRQPAQPQPAAPATTACVWPAGGLSSFPTDFSPPCIGDRSLSDFTSSISGNLPFPSPGFDFDCDVTVGPTSAFLTSAGTTVVHLPFQQAIADYASPLSGMELTPLL